MPNFRRTSVRKPAFHRTAAVAVLTVFVSSLASAATLCVNPGGNSGCKSTIGAAVSAASPHDTIVVWAGTYYEEVTISKSVSLVGAPHAWPIISALNKPVAIFVDGTAAAPNPGVADVLISGFRIRDANYEGILIANGWNVTVTNNVVADNNKSLDTSGGTCPGIPAFETNEGEDCGEGVHLMGTAHSFIVQNEIEHNAGGILITDETGPAYDNLISGNTVHDNPYDCGITLASHGPAKTLIPTATLPYGVTHNTISHNLSARNGLAVEGAGAGVGIFAPFPGTTAADNVVINNDVRDNGLPGVTMHNHAWAPSPAPAVNLNNNSIVDNYIAGNGKDTEDAATSGPTGINLFSLAPVNGTMIYGNTFGRESIDVAFRAPAGELAAHFNNFSDATGVDNLGAGTIDATENWWRCPSGPSGIKCSAATGPSIFTNPWLLTSFRGD
jgi:nitrous oxidase accessory protein NosD